MFGFKIKDRAINISLLANKDNKNNEKLLEREQ